LRREDFLEENRFSLRKRLEEKTGSLEKGGLLQGK